MPGQLSWKDLYLAEITRAKSARIEGNEGMARVCARRAVGIMIGEYLNRRGVANPGPSAYDRMRLFQSLPNITPPIRETVTHFLLHVAHDRTLPDQIDLIAEAEWLASKLMED
jgi:hypothetical protein